MKFIKAEDRAPVAHVDIETFTPDWAVKLSEYCLEDLSILEDTHEVKFDLEDLKASIKPANLHSFEVADDFGVSDGTSLNYDAISKAFAKIDLNNKWGTVISNKSIFADLMPGPTYYKYDEPWKFDFDKKVEKDIGIKPASEYHNITTTSLKPQYVLNESDLYDNKWYGSVLDMSAKQIQEEIDRDILDKLIKSECQNYTVSRWDDTSVIAASAAANITPKVDNTDYKAMWTELKKKLAIQEQLWVNELEYYKGNDEYTEARMVQAELACEAMEKIERNHGL